MSTTEPHHAASARGVAQGVGDETRRTCGIEGWQPVIPLMKQAREFLSTSWRHRRHANGVAPDAAEACLAGLSFKHERLAVLGETASSTGKCSVHVETDRWARLGMTEEEQTESSSGAAATGGPRKPQPHVS